MRFVTCAALALMLVSSKSAIGSETHPPQQYVVTVVLEETPTAISKEEGAIRADPQVAVLANEEAILDVGGERKLREKKIPFGTLLNRTFCVLSMLNPVRALG